MESQAKFVWVGSFVLISTVGLVAALLWLSGAAGGSSNKYFTIYFRSNSLNGLQKDSDVTMKGIKVGSVDEYRISPRSVEEVKVTLRLNEFAPVKEDTSAVIKRNLLTGLAWIELIGSSENSPLLSFVIDDEDYPVIPEGRTEFDEIAETIPKMLDRINEMVHRASLFMSRENSESLHKILSNVELFTASLAESSNRIDAVLKSIEQVAVDVSRLSDDLNKFVRKTGKSIDGLSSEAKETLVSLNRSVVGLDKDAKQMLRAVESASQVFAQEVTAVSQSLSEAAETFSKTVEEFEDPQSIITGPREKSLGPGEAIGR